MSYNENTQIQDKLRKFINNSCNDDELNDVINYFQKITSSNELPSVDEVLALINEKPTLDKTSVEKSFKKITYLKNRKQNLYRSMSIAATVTLLLSVGYYSFFNQNSTKKVEIVNNKNQITLTKQDGSVKIISKDKSEEITDNLGNVIGYQKGNSIVYNDNSKAEKLIFNELTVPFGEKFDLTLSDGTTVKLNSGSSIKYPVKFFKGQNREVYLKGEAFFNVSEDKNDSFIVAADALNIKVYGTAFNVSSYAEDTYSNVVLVKGSVSLYADKNSNNELKIKPGTKGSMYKESKKITTEPVSTKIYTAWIDGGLVFRNMKLKNIIKRLERHYDVVITNNNKNIENETFNASFHNVPLEKVLSYFKSSYHINYTIDSNKKVYIN